jgi:hypothetical protein
VFKGLCNPARHGGKKLSLKIRYHRQGTRRLAGHSWLIGEIERETSASLPHFRNKPPR